MKNVTTGYGVVKKLRSSKWVNYGSEKRGPHKISQYLRATMTASTSEILRLRKLNRVNISAKTMPKTSKRAQQAKEAAMKRWHPEAPTLDPLRLAFSVIVEGLEHEKNFSGDGLE